MFPDYRTPTSPTAGKAHWSELTHVFPKVLNLNCLSRAVPSFASVQRPPSEVSRAFSAGVTLAASVPTENRGWAMVDAKRNSDGMRAEGWKGRMVGRNQLRLLVIVGCSMKLKGLDDERQKWSERQDRVYFSPGLL